MAPIDMFAMRECYNQQQIMLCFNGPISRSLIEEIGNALRKGAERTAINAPMQGTAADIMKRAMVTVDSWLGTCGLDAKVILQVHDELVLEVREDQVEALKTGLLPLMSGAAALDVPLLVEAGVGDNWDEAH